MAGRGKFRVNHALIHSVYILCCFLTCCTPASATPTHTYSTWQTQELDSVASAWLIIRFVDTEAGFRFVPNGELIPEGVSFNVPGGTYTRTHDQTTYDQIRVDAELNDPVLDAIGAIIYTVEIDYWLGTGDPLVLEVDGKMQEIIQRNADPAAIYEAGFIYLDELYAMLQATSP